MYYPLTDIQADFEINRSIRYQITAKRNYFHRRGVQQQWVAFSKKNTKKLNILFCSSVILESNLYRRFYIMKHAGCPLDYGWIAVLDGPTAGVCDVWEKLRGPYPRILYSSTGTSQRAIIAKN